MKKETSENNGNILDSIDYEKEVRGKVPHTISQKDVLPPANDPYSVGDLPAGKSPFTTLLPPKKGKESNLIPKRNKTSLKASKML